MQLIQTIRRKSVTRNTMIVLAAIALGAAAATHALAAGPNGGVAGTAGHGGGHTAGGSGGASPGAVPSMPPPVFNPSSPYTVRQSPETPVSPNH
jgi:hypothetical protein